MSAAKGFLRGMVHLCQVAEKGVGCVCGGPVCVCLCGVGVLGGVEMSLTREHSSSMTAAGLG